MANRRMFSRTVCESDAFLDLPGTSQRLYFFLGLYADDEGFLKNPKSVLRMISATNDDLNMLIFKGFVIPFDSGVIVITHWKLHNTIKSDRFHPTTCVQEKAMLSRNISGEYLKLETGSNMDPQCLQLGSNLEPESSRGKTRLGKYREVEERAREALPSPASPADEGHDLSDQIAAHQHADDLIRRYKLPDGDLTREALLEDAEAVGWTKLEETLRQAALSNSRQMVSVSFYRSILHPTAKGGRMNAADPYSGYSAL